MPLVEVITTAQTSDDVIATMVAFVQRLGKTPVVVKDSPGFVVNRILMPYLIEAGYLFEHGARVEDIDEAMLDFGMPMGPVELADTVGLDICLSVAKNLGEKINIAVPEKLVAMVAKGTLGRKTGSGFYQYKNGKPVKNTVAEGSRAEDVEDRLILRIVNECAACLRDQIVEDADLLDAGMIFGTGFAPFRGGPMNYAKTRGYPAVVSRLQALADKYGERFTPDTHWQDLTQQ